MHWIKSLMLVALLIVPAPIWAYSVEISLDEVQAAVATLFPIKQQIPFATTVLSDPKVRIVNDSNRVRLAVNIQASFPNGIHSAGTAEIEGELGYDAAHGEFRLRQPVVTELRFGALPADYADLMKANVNALAEQILPSIVIYRLDERDFRQGMMRRVLKGVTVKDGKLIAELDW